MKQKLLGQVFTPKWIVELILDNIGYEGKDILNKKIIDPACGDGVFLCSIVSNIIDTALKENLSINKIKEILEENMYGIEIDETEYFNCIENLNNIVYEKLGIELDINWKIYNDNALIKYKDFINFFDYVVGNPPYIRVHNLDDKTRELIKNEFTFNKGMIDIYIYIIF